MKYQVDLNPDPWISISFGSGLKEAYTPVLYFVSKLIVKDYTYCHFVLPGCVHHRYIPIHHAFCAVNPWCHPPWSCRGHQILSLS